MRKLERSGFIRNFFGLLTWLAEDKNLRFLLGSIISTSYGLLAEDKIFAF
jgi:hypothetical protein